MHLSELKQKLLDNKIPERWYSLDEGLKPDACILYKNYSEWEFFYLDEKGRKHDFQVFTSEADAYAMLWNKMEYQLGFFGNQPDTKK